MKLWLFNVPPLVALHHISWEKKQTKCENCVWMSIFGANFECNEYKKGRDQRVLSAFHCPVSRSKRIVSFMSLYHTVPDKHSIIKVALCCRFAARENDHCLYNLYLSITIIKQYLHWNKHLQTCTIYLQRLSKFLWMTFKSNPLALNWGKCSKAGNVIAYSKPLEPFDIRVRSLLRTIHNIYIS